jgi:predicted ribosome quality control (RQC) complex YloA/Tae2 family protein
VNYKLATLETDARNDARKGHQDGRELRDFPEETKCIPGLKKLVCYPEDIPPDHAITKHTKKADNAGKRATGVRKAEEKVTAELRKTKAASERKEKAKAARKTTEAGRKAIAETAAEKCKAEACTAPPLNKPRLESVLSSGASICDTQNVRKTTT